MLPVKYLQDLKTSLVDKVDFVATFIEVLTFTADLTGSRAISNMSDKDVRRQIYNHGKAIDVAPPRRAGSIKPSSL